MDIINLKSQITCLLKKGFVLFFISGLYLSCINSFAVTYYIDPSSKSINQDGSFENPYLSWDDVSWQDSATYLQKRGTICEATKVLNVKASNVTLGAYGSGEKPIIKSLVGDRAKAIELGSSYSDVTIKNLEVYSVNDIVCAIIIGGTGPYLIDSCVLHDCSWGIRVFTITGKLTISNTEIYNIGDDGIYTQDTEDIEIYGCYIHDVNADLPIRETAGGDCIQITNEQGFLHIHNNILDHSAYGRKFCLIIGSAYSDKDQPHEALVENNLMIGYKDTAEITSGLYLKATISHLTFRNNIVKDAATGIWLDARTTAHNNIFIRCSEGINLTSGDTAFIANNTFVNNETGIKTNYSSVAEVYNNIFFKGNTTKQFYTLFGNITTDYNCYNIDSAGLYSGENSLSERQISKGQDMNSFVNNPGFVNLANEDFHLSSSSPCIDTALIITDITQDKDGVSIPSGKGPDIGAYEYSLASSLINKNDTEIINTIKVYPNPTTGIVTIDANGYDIQSISVYNITGKTLIKNSSLSSGNTIDLSPYDGNIFFISIQTKNKIITTKIIKD